MDAIVSATSPAELDRVESELDSRLRDLRPQYPALGRPELGRVDERAGEPREVRPGVRTSTTRFWIKCPVTGDLEMLEYWPDKSDQPLKTVHHDLMERIGGYSNLGSASQDDAKEYFALTATWQRFAIDTVHGSWGLYTFVDLTEEEEQSMRAAGGLHVALEERITRAADIVAAIAGQARRYFEIELPDEARRRIENRRALLQNRAELVRDLVVPKEWGGEEMRVEAVVPQPYQPARTGKPVSPDYGSEDAVETELAPSSAPGSDADLDLPEMSYRLSSKSFHDVLRSMRTWADAVERNPRGFGHLDEDSISDVLAATLNATVPNAGREVFSRSGRVDIHVIANVLAEGTGPAEVFLCETKKTDSEADVLEALDEQLFRYLTAHSTQAVLLALCPQADFNRAKSSVRTWAQKAGGFQHEGAEVVTDWPHYNYLVDGRTVEVCVATVSIPPSRTRAGKSK